MTPFSKTCAECPNLMYYPSAYALTGALKTGRRCKACIIKHKKTLVGNKNPFWGKKHSDETKRKSSAALKRVATNQSSERRKEVLQAMKRGRKIRATLGTNYEIWLAKGGRDYADEKMAAVAKKISFNSTGERNPMFGKPSPQGSGQGWKCYLDRIYCRSLREAIFIATELDGIPFESGEKRKYTILYQSYKGTNRTYRPDFVTDEFIIECKPKRLWHTPEVSAKAIAGTEFAKTIGKIYKLVDVEIKTDIVKSLVDSGRLKFLPQYQLKYEKWLLCI